VWQIVCGVVDGGEQVGQIAREWAGFVASGGIK